MRQKSIIILGSILCLSACLVFVFAFSFQGDESITISNPVADDLYVFGSSVILQEDVQNDLAAAGTRILVQGNVGQDLMAAGGDLRIGGSIGDDARIAGGRVLIDSSIEDDLMVAGGRISIGEDSYIGGDLAVTGVMVRIDGQVADRVFASGSDIIIGGKIGREVIIGDVDHLTILPGAEIGGDLTYASARPADIAPDADIGGEINFQMMEKAASGWLRGLGRTPLALFTATYIGGKVASFISLFVLGILLILAWPRVFEKFNQRMFSSLGISAGIGAIVLFGLPLAVLVILIVSVVLVMTLIGSGIGLMLMALNALLVIIYLVFIYASTIFLAYLLGRSIFSRSSVSFDNYGWKVLAYLVGLAIIAIVFAIPVLGWLARLAAVIFGLGGLSLIVRDWLACRSEY